MRLSGPAVAVIIIIIIIIKVVQSYNDKFSERKWCVSTSTTAAGNVLSSDATKSANATAATTGSVAEAATAPTIPPKHVWHSIRRLKEILNEQSSLLTK
jgi:hypothetical protein